MYNLRYHIASLVAVFLALSVGLVLGSIVVERGTIDRQQEALIKSLQTDFLRTNRENRELSNRVEESEEFASALIPHVVGGVLEGKQVVIVTNSGRTDGLSSAMNAIEQAGGTPAVVTLNAPGLSLDNEDTAAAMRATLHTSASGDQLARSVAASLSTEWARAGERPVTKALVDAQAMQLEDFGELQRADAVVIMAAFDGEPDPIAADVAEALRERGVRTVGAQARTAPTGVAGALAAAGFGAVNDLGTARGEYSLSVLLGGLAEGYYGTGPATDGPFPPIPEGGTSQ